MSHPFKTARCLLYRNGEYLLAIHSSFWGQRKRRWGLPGGQIERGETPRAAMLRELEEELNVTPGQVHEVGAFPYKRALHMVFGAELTEDISHYDESELLDIRWFSEPDIVDLSTSGALHADYELDAVRALKQMIQV